MAIKLVVNLAKKFIVKAKRARLLKNDTNKPVNIKLLENVIMLAIQTIAKL